jgi:hypothetical protein
MNGATEVAFVPSAISSGVVSITHNGGSGTCEPAPCICSAPPFRFWGGCRYTCGHAKAPRRCERPGREG